MRSGVLFGWFSERLRSLQGASAPWYAVVVTALVACALSAGPLLVWDYGFLDVSVYWGAIDHWFGGGELYEYARSTSSQTVEYGFTYPPFAAIVLSPLALLPLGAAQVLSVLVNLTLGFGCAALIVRAVAADPFDRLQLLATGALTVAGFMLKPWLDTLVLGQINLLILALVLVDVVVLDRRGSRLAGVGIGIAAAIKLTPAVLLLYYLATRKWRQLLTAMGAGAGATLLAAALAPQESWQYFTRYLWETGRVGSIDRLGNQSLAGMLARFTAPSPVPGWLLAVVALAFIAVVGWRLYASGRPDALAGITVVGVLGVLVSPVSWVHHAVWAVPALVLIGTAIAVLRREGIPAHRGRLIGMVVFLACGIVVWLTNFQTALGLPFVDYGEVSFLGRLLSSLKVYWLVGAVFLIPLQAGCRRASRLEGAGEG